MASEMASTRTTRTTRTTRLVLAVLVVLAAIPLAVALGVLEDPRWYPTVDDAQTELRVRDVGTADSPLIGLGGRIGIFGPDQGSHPGPLSFWALALPYRLLGGTSWALRVATALLHLTAVGLAMWLAARRGGLVPLVGVGLVALTLAQAFGPNALTTPWNPYLPILWWLTFLLAAWSLLCGDLRVLPVAVVAGSFCTQTHISYLGLVGGVAGLSAVTVAAHLLARRRGVRDRRRDVGSVVLGAAVGIVLWLPPLAEQVTKVRGGNLGRIFDHFAHPSEEQVGLSWGVDLLLANLNVWHLISEPVIDERSFLGGPTLPGRLLVMAWLVAAVVSWRRRYPLLLRLHALIAVVLVLGVVSVSRIFGPPWAYLALWGWGLCALMLVAVSWTACALAAALLPSPARRASAVAGTLGLVAVTLVMVVRFTVDAAYVQPLQPVVSASAATLVPQTIEALQEGTVPGGGRDGRYLVTDHDPVGGRGNLLVNELDREGFEVGGAQFLRVSLTWHRALAPEEATAQLHVAVGRDIATWEAKPGYRRIATWEPASEAERVEYEQLRRTITSDLEARGRLDLVALIDTTPATVRDVGELSEELLAGLDRLVEIGAPVAVLAGPPLLE